MTKTLNTCAKSIPFEEVVTFHGHACPGLALGYRVARAAMRRLRSDRSGDEEFVAVVENDACGVDAVQYLCGCTFGKGNLVFRDHGKQAFTFYNRQTGEGLRIYAEPADTDNPAEPEFAALKRKPKRTPDENDRLTLLMEQRIQRILSMPEKDFLTIAEPREPMPIKARIFNSGRCSACGERVMQTRLYSVDDHALCTACAPASTSQR
ncbi:MAG: FmdE family protein [Verrucomicrobiota bacterium]